MCAKKWMVGVLVGSLVGLILAAGADTHAADSDKDMRRVFAQSPWKATYICAAAADRMGAADASARNTAIHVAERAGVIPQGNGEAFRVLASAAVDELEIKGQLKAFSDQSCASAHVQPMGNW